MMRKGLVLSLAIVLMFGLLVFAGNKGEQKTLSGTLSCTGCDLKKAAGAHSQCKIYGHRHTLKLADGNYVSFMENDHSEMLLNAGGGKWHGQEVEVSGTYFAHANIIDVEDFQIKDKSYGWCAGHKDMDQCHTNMKKMHGNK